MYFWISAFDHRAIIVPKMHIVQCMHLEHCVLEVEEVVHQGVYLVHCVLIVEKVVRQVSH